MVVSSGNAWEVLRPCFATKSQGRADRGCSLPTIFDFAPAFVQLERVLSYFSRFVHLLENSTGFAMWVQRGCLQLERIVAVLCSLSLG